MKRHIPARLRGAAVANDIETIYHSVFAGFRPFLPLPSRALMPSLPGLRHAPSPLFARWAVLVWLSACLLLAPMGSLRHALTHLGEAAGASQDDAHAHEKLGHCDLCQLWDVLDATLPSSFAWVGGHAAHAAPVAPLPAGTDAIGGSWFQPRAPPPQA